MRQCTDDCILVNNDEPDLVNSSLKVISLEKPNLYARFRKASKFYCFFVKSSLQCATEIINLIDLLID